MYQEWSFLDKDEWLRGEWDNEPDCVRWIDEKTGYLCFIARNPSMGFLCGYVGIPWNHPLWRLDYDWAGINVHGGLTYSGSYDSDELGPTGHVLTRSLAGSRWFYGFDCGHMGDKFDIIVKPMLDMHAISMGDGPVEECPGTYRDLAFVKHNCSLMARLLKKKEYRGWRIILSPWWRRLKWSESSEPLVPDIREVLNNLRQQLGREESDE